MLKLTRILRLLKQLRARVAELEQENHRLTMEVVNLQSSYGHQDNLVKILTERVDSLVASLVITDSKVNRVKFSNS